MRKEWKVPIQSSITVSNITAQPNLFLKFTQYIPLASTDMLHQVELAYTFFNKFFKLATTKLCCVTLFEVGGINNVALQVAAICCSYYFTLNSGIKKKLGFIMRFTIDLLQACFLITCEVQSLLSKFVMLFCTRVVLLFEE